MNNETISRELYNIVYNKSYFMISWYEGAVLPENHPNYYDGRIDIKISKNINQFYGNINIEKDEYKISSEIVDSLYNYIDTNINRLTKIALNQNTEDYAGVADSLNIKYKSIYISISGLNATNEDDYNEIISIKKDIKDILLSNK